MSEIIALINRLYKEEGRWQDVAERIGKYSGSLWSKIASGTRHAKPEHVNLVRIACGLPSVEIDALDIVRQSGIDTVIQLSRLPNTALLVRKTGDIVSATVKTGILPVGKTPSVRVTSCHSVSKRRVARPVETVSISEIGTVSVKSKKFRIALQDRVSAAAKRAAEVTCNLTPDDALAALGI